MRIVHITQGIPDVSKTCAFLLGLRIIDSLRGRTTTPQELQDSLFQPEIRHIGRHRLCGKLYPFVRLFLNKLLINCPEKTVGPEVSFLSGSGKDDGKFWVHSLQFRQKTVTVTGLIGMFELFRVKKIAIISLDYQGRMGQTFQVPQNLVEHSNTGKISKQVLKGLSFHHRKGSLGRVQGEPGTGLMFPLGGLGFKKDLFVTAVFIFIGFIQD